jgi:hypothetical protein
MVEMRLRRSAKREGWMNLAVVAAEAIEAPRVLAHEAVR